MRPSRARVVLVLGERLAAIERRRGDELYYLFPGGGIEPGESATEAAQREVREELGLDVRIGPCVAEVTYNGNVHVFFAAERISGEFGRGDGEEMRGLSPPENGSYTAVMLPLADLNRLPLHPQGVARLAQAFPTDGWPAEPLRFVDPGRSGR